MPAPVTHEGVDDRASSLALEEADTIGRYSILSLLGEGGMGRVYAAFDDQLDRRVALKVLKVAPSQDARDRILREAQAMARLSHPNVAVIFEATEHDGELFISMEHIEGETLGDWCRSDARSWHEALVAYVQAGRGLAAAHAKGLVHRDFKPHNAMVDAQGRVRVLDFGLVARRSETSSVAPESSITPPPRQRALDRPLTETGTVMGTPAYMAPEQFTGGAVDHRCDQFSFCVALWEVLYGQRPYRGASRIELLTQIAQGRIDEPAQRKVPARLRAVLERGLRPLADERWPDMPALLEALESFVPADERRTGRSTDPFWASLVAVAVWTVLLSLTSGSNGSTSLEGVLRLMVGLAMIGGLPAAVIGFVARKGASVDSLGRPRRWWRRVLGAWATFPALGFSTIVFVIRDLADWLLVAVVGYAAIMASALALVLVVLEHTLSRSRPWWQSSIISSVVGGVMLLPPILLALQQGLPRILVMMAPITGIIATAAAVSLARPAE